MTKRRDVRVTIGLACTICTCKDAGDKSKGISRYTTRKNRRNTPIRLELKKFCACCRKHTFYKELKR
uniref:Large ribosomal subunit protein bL33c n=1 Tax=Microsorum cuspidatum TaxID=187367 RepID=A0A7T1C5S2_9MONI|nr:ribosomal protein L33 [Microsorum cuspidatum]QPM99622.1 ribosomal protein L33 [Microsorum cuspidatum]